MDRPRASLLVTVSVSYLTNQAATANCVLAILFFAPFSESEQLGSHVRPMKLMSKPVSPVELTSDEHSRGTGPADQEYRGLEAAAPALLRSKRSDDQGRSVTPVRARASSGRVIVSILTLLVVGRIALGDRGAPGSASPRTSATGSCTPCHRRATRCPSRPVAHSPHPRRLMIPSPLAPRPSPLAPRRRRHDRHRSGWRPLLVISVSASASRNQEP